MQAFTHTIDGKAVPGHGAFPVINPSTGEAFAECPDASREDLDAAVAAARKALPAWRALSFAERRAPIVKLAEVLLANEADLAALLTREQGKPVTRALAEIRRAADDLIKISAMDVQGELLRNGAGEAAELHYRPLGVVGAITPWNVPIILACQKIAQALYTGNTMVLKPSPFTPLATLELGRLSRGVLPDGVLNVIAGGNDLGAWLTTHPGIDKITFTGSGPTGQKVMASAAAGMKRVTLELGGNDAAIVLKDADVPKVAQAIFTAAFVNSGQICMAVKRVYADAEIYDDLVEAIAVHARAAKVGDGFGEGIEFGPVQNKAQYEKVLGMIEEARSHPGARIAAGGQPFPGKGYFIAPTVVAGLDDGARLVDEEPFGPVLPVVRFTDEADAVARANRSEFGLSGSVWSEDVERAKELASQLEVGTAWVNRHGGADPLLPFGGVKMSGLGREHGMMGLLSYMEPLVIHVAGDPR